MLLLPRLSLLLPFWPLNAFGEGESNEDEDEVGDEDDGGDEANVEDNFRKHGRVFSFDEDEGCCRERNTLNEMGKKTPSNNGSSKEIIS